MSASGSGEPALDPALYQLLERLIAFDTTSRNSNLELIAWVKDYLSGFGIESLLVHDETGSKANLYATVGPEDGPDFAQATQMRMVDQERRQSLWRWVLLAAFSLFVSETLLSNWVSRKAGVPGVATS